MQDYRQTQNGSYLLRTPSSVSSRRVDFKPAGPEFYVYTDIQVNEQLAQVFDQLVVQSLQSYVDTIQIRTMAEDYYSSKMQLT